MYMYSKMIFIQRSSFNVRVLLFGRHNVISTERRFSCSWSLKPSSGKVYLFPYNDDLPKTVSGELIEFLTFIRFLTHFHTRQQQICI